MSRPRITTAQLARLTPQLTERDLAIAATLAKTRMMVGSQLQRLHFTDGTPLSNTRVRQARLERLVELQVLAALERRVGGYGGGSEGLVYALGPAGQRLAANRGPAGGRVQRPWTPSLPFVRHVLGVSELLVRLSEADRGGRLELLDFTPEPECWRSFTAATGSREVLKPDAYLRLGVGDYVDHYFVEIDCNTEGMQALGRKLDRYWAYWATGKADPFPQVLWLVPHQRRLEQVIAAAGRQPAESWTLHRILLFRQAIDALAEDTGQ